MNNDIIIGLLTGYGWRWYVTQIRIERTPLCICHSDWFQRMDLSRLWWIFPSRWSYLLLVYYIFDCFFLMCFCYWLKFVCHLKEMKELNKEKNTSFVSELNAHKKVLFISNWICSNFRVMSSLAIALTKYTFRRNQRNKQRKSAICLKSFVV